jgi:hypothetical protein
MRSIPDILLLLFVLSLSTHGQAQGVISRIYLSAPGLDVEIVDEKARNDFRFGGGPGNTLNRQPNWKPKSWIVDDWNHPVAPPNASLPRVRATFTIDRGSARGARPYVVFYVYDPAVRQGFVYLPGRGEPFYEENVNLLFRGDQFEGHWFHTTPEWTSQAQATLENGGR